MFDVMRPGIQFDGPTHPPSPGVVVSFSAQVHGHHPPAETQAIGYSDQGGDRFHLGAGRSAGLPTLLLLHHQEDPAENPVLCGLAQELQGPPHVSPASPALMAPTSQISHFTRSARR